SRRFDERRGKMEDKVIEYYSKFKEIYTKENYPEWFKFCKSYNVKKGFADVGYKENQLGHELGHYAIFQTPIYKEKEIVIVGNNNSWFIPNKYMMKESLEIVKDLEEGIPEKNFLTRNESHYSRDLRSYFEILGEDSKRLFERAIGINRLWIQTGPKCPPSECELKEEMKSNFDLKDEWKILQENCEKWTKEIIELINPSLLLLLSGAAQKLYPQGFHNKGFWVQHSYAPSYKYPTG
ncbi:uncharacterized protein METZ01_LOCUS494804, partial [marine metagenome]